MTPTKNYLSDQNWLDLSFFNHNIYMKNIGNSKVFWSIINKILKDGLLDAILVKVFPKNAVFIEMVNVTTLETILTHRNEKLEKLQITFIYIL